MNRSQRIAAAAIGLTAGVCVARRLLRESTLQQLGGKVVVITGGARGLGLAIARQCLAYGASIAICSRDRAQLQAAEQRLLEEYPGSRVLIRRCDVTQGDEVEQFIEETIDRFGGIDILINNAGVIQVGPWNTMTREDYEESLGVHFWGPYNTFHAAIDTLAKRQGRVVNISSIGGNVSIPHLLPYCAGKFALVGFSEGLAAEVAQYGISVTTVSPGLMRTGSARNAWFKGQHRKEYTWFSISDSLPVLTISADEAARRILLAALRRRASLVFPFTSRVPTMIRGLAPSLTVRVLGIVNRILPGRGGVGTRRIRGSGSQSWLSPSLLTTLSDHAAVRNNEVW